MTREDRVELNDSIIIGLLDATESSVVQVGSIVRVAIAIGLHTRVDTGGVAAPDIGPDSDERLAGVHVDELDVRHEGDTDLILGEVGADILAQDVEGANLALGVEYRAARAVEHNGLVVLSRRGINIALVISPQDADGASLVEVVALAVWGCSCREAGSASRTLRLKSKFAIGGT